MTLREYMDKYRLSLRKMEIKTGIDFRVLSRYVNGGSLPSLRSAFKIYKATNKKVKLEDWFNG